MRSFLVLTFNKLYWNYQIMRMRLAVHLAKMGEKHFYNILSEKLKARKQLKDVGMDLKIT